MTARSAEVSRNDLPARSRATASLTSPCFRCITIRPDSGPTWRHRRMLRRQPRPWPRRYSARVFPASLLDIARQASLIEIPERA